MTLENVLLERQILKNVSLAHPFYYPKFGLTAHFIGTGVNFGECDVLTTHSGETDVLTTHSLMTHFIGETSGNTAA